MTLFVSGITIAYDQAEMLKHLVVSLKFCTSYLNKVVSILPQKFLVNFVCLGTRDYKHTFDTRLLDHAETTYGAQLSSCSYAFERYANRLRADYSIPVQASVEDAIRLYFLLIADMELMMSNDNTE